MQLLYIFWLLYSNRLACSSVRPENSELKENFESHQCGCFLTFLVVVESCTEWMVSWVVLGYGMYLNSLLLSKRMLYSCDLDISCFLLTWRGKLHRYHNLYLSKLGLDIKLHIYKKTFFLKCFQCLKALLRSLKMNWVVAGV